VLDDAATPAPATTVEPLTALRTGNGSTITLLPDGEVMFGVQNDAPFGRGTLYGWRTGMVSPREITQWTRNDFGAVPLAGETLYWAFSQTNGPTTTSQAWSAPRAGGQAQQVWTSGAPSRLRSDGKNAFVSAAEGDALALYRLEGAEAKEELRLSGQKAQLEFAVDERSFFVLVGTPGQASLRLVEVDRTTRKQTVLVESIQAVNQMRAEGGFLYYSAEEADGTRSIRRVARDGKCAVALVAVPKENLGREFLVKRDRLVWLSRSITLNDRGDGVRETRLGALDLRTGKASVAYSGVAMIGAFGFDGGAVYLLDNSARRLVRASGF
jgi:hypothetical protein